VHGALLRVTRPGECRSFLVDPRFAKRADAKAAVCLAALSEGIGAYIRSLSAAAEAKISPEIRRRAIEQILPLLITEYAKIWPAKLPEMFDYFKERDGSECHIVLSIMY
jgi:hypothetical protein